MKIEGPGKSSNIKGASKAGSKKPTGDASFGGMVEDTEAAAPQSGVSGVMTISHIDALLSLQEAGDGTSGGAAKAARERAGSLLDQLDRVRMGLLTGSLPQSTLIRLSHMLQSHRDKVVDPVLADILDEIDLRAQVELAKLQNIK